MSRRMPDTQVIAHRGASGHTLEHTLAAYDLALNQGADVLEVDVRACADGGLVLVHDETLLRTAGDPRSVIDLTAPELDAVPAPGRPLRLETVLRRYRRRTRFLVDLKDPSPAWEERVGALVTELRLRRRVTVQSFERESLRRLRAAAPWLALSALYHRDESAAVDLDDAASYARGVSVWHGAVDAAFVSAAHARGLAVSAWTPDTPGDVERLLALSVDGIITNLPDMAAGVRDRVADRRAAS
jgi:glycerophosphoryl diester phosphodiesterase